MSGDKSEKHTSIVERSTAIFEQSPFSIQILSPDGKTIRVNKAWEQLWGVTLDKIDGYNILEDRQLIEKGIMPLIERAFAGETVALPPIPYDPNNTIPDVTDNIESERWTRAVMYPIKDAFGQIFEIVLIHEDITEQKRAEEKFKESEFRYRMLFETTLDGIMVVDERGVYIDVNESLCRILKTSREKLIGSHFSEHMLPERAEDARKGFEALRDTGVFYGDFPMRAADGSVVELSWSSRANFMPGLHVCVARDITNRRKVEEALRSSELRYQRAAEAARVGVWELNLETEELYIAPNLKGLLGYSDDEIENDLQNWCELVHPDDKEKTIAASKAHIEGETPKYKTEVRRRHKDGHYLWFLAQGIALRDETGKAYRLTGSDTDITQQKLLEDELRNSEERYRSLLENANDIIYSHDLEGRYLTINRAGEEITGWTRAEILGGLNIGQVVAPEYLDRAKQMIKWKLENPNPTIYELDIIKKDGRRLTLEVSTRVAFRDGKPIAIEGVGRDITERKQAERDKAQLAEQIERQRKHLQEMVASIPGVVWEAWGEPDEANQRIDFVSKYVEAMLGYTVEEWLSTPNFWLTIVHPEDKKRAAEESAKKFKAGGGISRFRWMTKDGRAIWVEAHSATILDENGNPVGMRGVTMDITERRQKEEVERFLAEASTTLASSLDYETTLSSIAKLSVPNFADWCAVDIVGEDGELNRLAVAHVDPEKIVWANEMYAKYPPVKDAAVGIYNVLRTGQTEFYPSISDEMLVKSARDEQHLELMRQIGFRSAMIVPLKIREEVLGVLTFVNSESRHHRQEDLMAAEDLASRAALAIENARLFRVEQQTRRVAERTSNHLARLQAVSEALSQALLPEQVAKAVIEQGINSLGAHAGTVVSFDEQKAELELIGAVGFPKEVINKWRRFNLGHNVPISDAVRSKKPVLVDSFDSFGERYPDLGILSSITGSKALAAFPLIIENRTIGALGLSFRIEQNFSEDDCAFMLSLAQQCAQVLERARLYKNERELRAEAEAANRMKDEFLATVSHELRTPLNAIVGWSNLLKSNKLNGDEVVRAIETIERNGKTQAQIIEDLLDVSRIITGKLHLDMRPTDLDSVIRTTLETIRPAADSKNIRLALDLEQVSQIMGDPARLQQILWNLLSNAIKFTPNDGKIFVNMRRDGTNARVSIKDTGQGIASEFLPFVFDRFRQADGTTTRRHGGLGLGLSIVRHLVEMHGGSVYAESEGENLGSTFTITLPLVIARNNDVASRIETDALQVDNTDSLKGLRILIVDDEDDARILLNTIIETCGAETKAAKSAAEALEIFEDFNPDVLISDIGMPGEDGYSLIRKIRSLESNGKGIPAIALTAYAREEDRVRALVAGFQIHVSKPINPIELIAVINSLAGFRN